MPLKAWGTLTSGLVLGLALLVLAGCTAPVTSADPTFSAAPGSSCGAGATVSDSDELRSALDTASPGDSIVLAPGTYAGSFSITRSGSGARPITLCGPREAILTGESVSIGTTLHLDGVTGWKLEGFAVSGGQKGVLLDASSANSISGLSISHVGNEALHLRAGSSDNTVDGNTIANTGLKTAKFGEGIYVGSAQSNWCSISGCEADRSDRNVITGNTISATTAENIDIKEGTTGGELRGNILDGAGSAAADSLIDIKGSDWTIAGNMGTNAPRDGSQVHVILAPWGSGNRFAGNQFAVPSDGFVVDVVGDARNTSNVVECDNGADPAAGSANADGTAVADETAAGTSPNSATSTGTGADGDTDGIGATGSVGAGGFDPRLSNVDCT